MWEYCLSISLKLSTQCRTIYYYKATLLLLQERPWNQKRYLAVVKELPHRKKIICQNQRIRLRYTHYNSRSAARVGPQTHFLSFLINGLSKSLCGNLSVCRRHNNILYRRNDEFANKHTKQCSG